MCVSPLMFTEWMMSKWIIAANWLSLTDGSSDTLTQYRQPHLRRGRMTAPAFSQLGLSPFLCESLGSPCGCRELSVPAVGSLFQLSHCSQTTVWTQGSPSTGNVMGTTSTWVPWWPSAATRATHWATASPWSVSPTSSGAGPCPAVKVSLTRRGRESRGAYSAVKTQTRTPRPSVSEEWEVWTRGGIGS